METLIKIEKPCLENWETMKIGLHSRFCHNCQKNVIDFTNKDRKEILEYLLANQTEGVCGRVYRSQLDFSTTDLLVTIQALSKQNKNTNLSFYLLTVGTMILASCNNTIEPKISLKSSITKVQLDTIAKNVINKATTNAIKCKEEKGKSMIEDEEIMGDIVAYDYDTIKREDEPYYSVDKMPEFKGGVRNLINFINQNLEYPEWEKDNYIQGEVFANFVINKSGQITKVKILRSVEGSKNFDKEVIRVINKMPDWIPGQLEGKNVEVQFNLPVSFKL